MARTLTLTFEGRNELLLQAIEAYEKADLFEDEDGNSVKLSREEIALNMLMEGCLEWVQDVMGLPEELEENIRTEFELDEEGDGEECEQPDCELHDHDDNAKGPHLNN